jgi:hypothetical protein
MALFVLREGYRVEATLTGGRVIHLRTGDSLELSFVEVQLLARANAGGLTADDPALRPVIRKLSSLGLLEKVSPAAQAGAPAPVGTKEEKGMWVFSPGAGEPIKLIEPLPPTESPHQKPVESPARKAVEGSPVPAAPFPKAKPIPAPTAEPADSNRPTWLSGTKTRPEVTEPEATPIDSEEISLIEEPPDFSFFEPVAPELVTTEPPPPEPPATPAASPAEPLAPSPGPAAKVVADKLIPLFRADLKLSRNGSLFDVTDPSSGKTFAFYDFELSISRMLNGSRTYPQVVEAANRLGIPVNLESLRQFVRQLDRYGFLSPEGAKADTVPPESSIWGKREKWDDSIRSLFQSGLRLMRQGRYYESQAYFEAILEHDRGNPEATEMLEQVRQHLATVPPAEAIPLVAGPEQPGDGSGMPITLTDEAAITVVDDTAITVADELPTAEAGTAEPKAEELPDPFEAPTEQLQATPDLPATPAPASLPTPTTAKPSRPLAPMILGAVLVAVLAATGVWYLGLRTPKPKPTALSDASRPAALAADASGAAIEDAGAEQAADAASAIVADAAASEPDASPTAEGGADAAASLTDASAPTVSAGDWIVADITRRGRVNMGELRATVAGSVTWSVASQAKVKGGQVVGQLVSEGGQSEPLKAPKVGLLFTKVADGEDSKVGDLLATFPYFEAYAQAQVAAASAPQPGWTCEVVDEAGQTAPCKVTSAEARKGGFFVIATVEALWFDAAPKVKLRLKPAP